MRFLSVFDTSSPTPVIDPALGRLDSVTSRQVSAYLRAGVPLIGTSHRVPDAFTGSPAPIVPVSIHTDGTYVWSMAVAFIMPQLRWYLPCRYAQMLLQQSRISAPSWPLSEQHCPSMSGWVGSILIMQI